MVMTQSLARNAFLALVVLAVFPALPAAADTEFDVSAEIRVRYEADDRTFLESEDFEHSVFQRTRVRFDVRHGDGAEGVVAVQDSRIWGDEGGTTEDTQNVDLLLGFLRFHPGDVATVEVGRQELSYGRERVIGDLDFYNVGQTFDALRVTADFSDSWLDFLFAKVSDLSETGIDENLAAAFFHADMADQGLEFEPFLLYKENTDRRQFLTAPGIYAHWSRDRLWADGDFVWQTGQQRGGDIDAFLFALDFGMDLSHEADGRSGASIGYATYTGDDPGDDNDSAYDPLYADNWSYFGIMDVADDFVNRVVVEDADLPALGLRDFHAKVWLGLSENVKLKVVGSLFRSDIEVDLGPGGANGRDVGKEIDVVLKSRLAEGIDLSFGGGYFLSGDLVEAVIDDENATWAYVQATGSF